MKQQELTIKADGINYHLHLIQDRLKIRDESQGNITIGMILDGANKRITKKGKIEALTSLNGRFKLKKGKTCGRFTSKQEYYSEEDCQHSVYNLDLKDKNLVIELGMRCFYTDHSEHVSMGGCIVKTRKHWYEPWNEVRLENPEICWGD
jgi:hypothetical protein